MRQVDYPGNVRGRFTDAPTPDGLGGTIITASFLNAVNFEITNAIKESQIDLNPAEENQLSTAIQKRIDQAKAELNGAIDILNLLNASLRTSIEGINEQLTSLTSSLKWTPLTEAEFAVRLTLPQSNRTGNSTGLVTSYRFDGALSDPDVSLATYRLTETCICQGTATGSSRVQVAGLLPNAVNHCHFILILNAGTLSSAPQFTGTISFTKSVKTNASGSAEFDIQEFITLATLARFSSAPTQLVNLYMTSVSAFGLFREE
jgi:hypothetical protein